MKYFVLLLIFILPLLSLSQSNKKEYLAQYGVDKDSLQELSFKDEDNFKDFIKVFEDKQGFALPKFFIIDNTGKLLKHELDIYIKECGKGDVEKLKKYFKKSPTIFDLNKYFVEELKAPKKDNFIVIFVWIQEANFYNKHTFETYNTWRDNDNIEFYFLNLKYE